jgi:hypothetical protein
MNEWQAMEREFKKAFIDYAENKKANDELRKLKMKDGHIDTYIARFAQLAHRGGHNVDQPELLRLFGQGLPQTLANKCLELNNPNTFEEWAQAAQRNHKIYLKQLALSGPVRSGFFTIFEYNRDWDWSTVLKNFAKLGLDCIRPVNHGL